jgi:hypothetical protein
MKLRRIERDGEITQARVMMPEKLTARVEAYLIYYEQHYGTSIDLREFGLLAFEAILDSDVAFHRWQKSELPAEKKPKKKQAVNGHDEQVVRE